MGFQWWKRLSLSWRAYACEDWYNNNNMATSSSSYIYVVSIYAYRVRRKKTFWRAFNIRSFYYPGICIFYEYIKGIDFNFILWIKSDMITLLLEYEFWKTVLYILNGSHYNIDFVSSRKLQKKKTKKNVEKLLYWLCLYLCVKGIRHIIHKGF